MSLNLTLCLSPAELTASMLEHALLEYDTQPTSPTSNSVPTRFVPRQPIFDRCQRVYGYELLFQSGLGTVFGGEDGDLASQKVIHDLLPFGMEALTEGRKAFISLPSPRPFRGRTSLASNSTTCVYCKRSTIPN